MLCILLVLLDVAPFNKMSWSALANQWVLIKFSPYNMHKATKKRIKENWGKKNTWMRKELQNKPAPD